MSNGEFKEVRLLAIPLDRLEENVMEYGKGAITSISGIAMLPFTGENTGLFIVAAVLVGLGVSVLLASLVMARMSRQNS